MLACIIPLSLRNVGGAFDTICPPLSAGGGRAIAPSAPGFAAYALNRYQNVYILDFIGAKDDAGGGDVRSCSQIVVTSSVRALKGKLWSD